MHFVLEINLSGKIPSEMKVALRYKLLTPLTLLSLILLLTLCTLLTLLIHRFGAKGLKTFQRLPPPAEGCSDLQKKARGRRTQEVGIGRTRLVGIRRCARLAQKSSKKPAAFL